MIQKTQKTLKKAHIQQKLSSDILKNMLDMDVMFWGGRHTSHGLTLKRLLNRQPTERQKPPHFFSALFLLTKIWRE